MWPFVRELYRLRIPVSAETVEFVVTASWTVLAAYLVVYLVHVIWAVRRGYAINPIKYVFIGSSYFLWYFCAWQTSSFLVWGIAHRIMHGAQYIVMVYCICDARQRPNTPKVDSPHRSFDQDISGAFCSWDCFIQSSFRSSPEVSWVFSCSAGENFPNLYQAIPSLGLDPMSPDEGFGLVANAFLNSLGMTHYYFDSFIWKVRDRRIQGGLT